VPSSSARTLTPTRPDGHESDREGQRLVRVPVQERSRRTVERILTAAADLVAREGVGPFTTAAVARAAGVNIATLYSYFPDKMAILRELVHRQEAGRLAEMRRNLADLTADNWREWNDTVLRFTARFRVDQPGGMELRRAIRGTPELRELDDAGTLALAASVADRLREVWPRLSEEDSRTIAQMTLITVSATLDASCTNGTINDVLVGELVLLVNLYWSHYFD